MKEDNGLLNLAEDCKKFLDKAEKELNERAIKNGYLSGEDFDEVLGLKLNPDAPWIYNQE